MEINLAGKTAVVTGGNSGIGRAISLALARCGADVAITFYGDDQTTTADEIRDLGRRAFLLRLDATDSAAVNRVFAQAAQDLGGRIDIIDILVNNAGHLVGRVPIAEMSDEHWFKVINVNLSSCFFCCRAALPYMKTGWGRIVNMSSLPGRDGGGPGAVAYAASNGGVVTLTRGLVAGRGITVNAVAPGMVLGTRFHAAFTPESAQQATIGRTPLARAGVPEDVANAVLFLVSDLGAFLPRKVASSIAGMPAAVAGISTWMLGARPAKWTACSTMRAAWR